MNFILLYKICYNLINVKTDDIKPTRLSSITLLQYQLQLFHFTFSTFY